MRPSSLAASRLGVRFLAQQDLDPGEAAALARQFFLACDTFADNPKLVDALTDIGRAPQARQRLVARVFDALAAPVLGALQQLVSQRWACPDDLAEVADYLGVHVLVQGAKAEGRAERLQQQLFEVAETIKGDVSLRRVLADRSRSKPQQRAQLVERVFDTAVEPDALTLAARAALRAGSSPLALKLRDYRDQIAQELGCRVATVRTATPLTPPQRSRLVAALERIYGSKMLLNIAQDPALVGGMRVSVGADVYDGTLRTALAGAQRSLAG